jgi:hypothetical protein
LPKSILEIQVDDSQFRKYVEAFDKYRDQLKQMPGPWQETGESIKLGAAGIAAMTVALDLHYDKARKLAELEEKAAEERLKADEEHSRQLDEQASKEKEAERRRDKAIEQTKKIAKNMLDIGVSIGKWALFGGAASLVAGAFTMWGLDKFAAGIGREREMAQGVGVSIGERQALNVQMSRYFNVNSVLENIAESRADPGRRAVFAAMGINPQGKSNADLALEMATKARELYQQSGGNEAYLNARKVTQIFTMDELRKMAAARPGELPASIAATRRDVGRFGALSDKDAEIWQKFSIRVNEAGRFIENVFIDKLSALDKAGTLDKIIEGFEKLAIQVVDRIDFNALGEGLGKFADYIGSKKFQDDFQTFVNSVSAIASKIVAGLRLMHMIPEASDYSEREGVRKAQEAATKAAIFNAHQDIQATRLELQRVQHDPGWSPERRQKRIAELQVQLNAQIDKVQHLTGGLADIYAARIADQRAQAADAAHDAAVDAQVAAGNDGGGARGIPGASGRGAKSRVSGNDIAAMQYYMSRGWSKYAAAGMVAQLDLESGNRANPPGSNDSGLAYGSAQWHEKGVGRQSRYNAWAAANQLPDLRHSTLPQQWAFSEYEARTYYGAAYAAAQRAGSAGAAGQALTPYEGPADIAQRNRQVAVRAEILIHSNTGSAVAPTVNAASQ